MGNDNGELSSMLNIAHLGLVTPVLPCQSG
jgi:hypothetical protein